MKKIIILLILLTITGCTGIIPGANRETITLPEINTGTQGLQISYLQDMPSYELFENQLFEIGLELHNKGASDISDGLYNIAVDEQQITLIDGRMNRFKAKGKSVYNPEGGKQIINIKAKTKSLEGRLSTQSTSIITTACYSYTTKATQLTCIDTKPLKEEEKACKISSTSTKQGQGGPIGVTRIEPRMIPHQNPELITPTYIIEIENLGTGQVINTNSIYEACTGQEISEENYDTIIINAQLSNKKMTCQPETLKLKQDQNKIICKLEQGISKNAGNYQTPITIELNYGYVESKPKTIRITKTS